MAADDTCPTAVAIRSYMRNSGWRESTQGTVGSVWTKGDAKFCVPHEGDDPDLIQRALVRLASAEGRTPEETAAAILAHRNAQGNSPVSATGDTARGVPASPDSSRGRTGADVRERLGRLVHQERLDAEAERAAAEGRRRFLLEPWGERTEWQRELDIRIGDAVAAAVREADGATLAAITDACRSIPSPIAERIMAIIGTGAEASHA